MLYLERKAMNLNYARGGGKMKRVQVSVEYMEGRGLAFGVLLVGVMDDKYIYARRVSEETFRPQEDYMKILKDSTADDAENVNAMFESECRSISVALEIGLSDERFQPIKKNSAIVAEIEKAVEDFHKAIGYP